MYEPGVSRFRLGSTAPAGNRLISAVSIWALSQAFGSHCVPGAIGPGPSGSCMTPTTPPPPVPNAPVFPMYTPQNDPSPAAATGPPGKVVTSPGTPTTG